MRKILLIFLAAVATVLISSTAASAAEFADERINKIINCESKHTEFLEIGESKFSLRYVYSSDYKHCVSLFKHPAWFADEPERTKLLLELISYLEGKDIDKSARDRPSTDATVTPQWIKTDAKLWFEGKQTDSRFAYGIRHMIDSKIIVPPNVGIQYEELRIPSWFKNNAHWWAEGVISDQEYRLAIEFLMGKSILSV